MTIIIRALAHKAVRAAAVSIAMVATLFISGTINAHEFKVGNLEIVHPWSRETQHGAKVAVGYLVIRNNGKTANRLISATGDIANRTEIHEMAVDGNRVMTMRPLPAGLEVPAGGELALEPGSFHVMFMDLKRSAKEGESFEGTLTFEKAGSLTVEYSVDKMGGKINHSGHGN